MFELLFVWIVGALGIAGLGFLGFCFVRNVTRAFVKAASVDEPNDALRI